MRGIIRGLNQDKMIINLETDRFGEYECINGKWVLTDRDSCDT